jgi:hypothetical protein
VVAVVLEGGAVVKVAETVVEEIEVDLPNVLF